MYESTEQLDSFNAAVMAFAIRFERDLTARWEDRESAIQSAIVATPVREKYRFFRQFFEDAKNEISLIVHRSFASLLQVAAANRERLEGQSPLEWTYSQILTQVCDFLGLNEVFDQASDPRNDSRVLASAARLATGKGWWSDDGPSDTFVLPRWTEVPHPVLMLWAPQSSEVTPQEEAEVEGEKLSRAETLEWVKRTEFLIRKRIELQMDDDMWNGIIEAGKAGISILHPVSSDTAPMVDTQAEALGNEKKLQNKFVREGRTWLIAFEGEVCHLTPRLGLDYIAVILQRAGDEIRALELQTSVRGIPRGVHQTLALKSIENDRHEEASAEEDYHSVNRRDFAEDEMVDATARRQAESRLQDLEDQIAYYSEVSDTEKVATLEDEHRQLESYLSTSINIHGRSRTFPGENERARQSITQRLKDAYKLIRTQAPRTADHLESKIKKGLTFVYLDSSTPWDIRR